MSTADASRLPLSMARAVPADAVPAAAAALPKSNAHERAPELRSIEILRDILRGLIIVLMVL